MEGYSQLHQNQLYLGKRMSSSRPPRVEIDNDVSAYYTVIDVYANDRIGILHDIARAMRSLGLYIEVSKISTKVDQVADVFYVKDIFGHKITEAKKLNGIKKALSEALAESPKEA
jgi:[protein-PII] uridylyltransferase